MEKVNWEQLKVSSIFGKEKFAIMSNFNFQKKIKYREKHFTGTFLAEFKKA